ncbi:hypothetical protein [Cloacibacillus porcorum]|uniref:hypothetical protein n=1 Tax=Cloacibacillus porcorum TaxID=1197717 RepID=UPI0023F15E7A|nr:hypothetical protein [Cloacibacillus porcorum]MCC8184982.1 hypothetical protein [Cloacibacillus porcorum]
MSIKHFCDVCGKEYKTHLGKTISIFMSTGREETEPAFYSTDTCGECVPKIAVRFATFINELNSECVHNED